jgi:hypothetical protein
VPGHASSQYEGVGEVEIANRRTRGDAYHGQAEQKEKKKTTAYLRKGSKEK